VLRALCRLQASSGAAGGPPEAPAPTRDRGVMRREPIEAVRDATARVRRAKESAARSVIGHPYDQKDPAAGAAPSISVAPPRRRASSMRSLEGRAGRRRYHRHLHDLRGRQRRLNP
jgi:hypothetical protein